MIGLICAMPQEIQKLYDDMISQEIISVGGRTFYQGRLYQQPVVLVLSGVGKVAASITTTILLERFQPTSILFIGTAGGISPQVHIGDVVVASQLVQHDFSVDPTPTFRIPIINKSYFDTNPILSQMARHMANTYLFQHFVSSISLQTRQQFNLHQPVVHSGTVASGDQFIADFQKKEWLFSFVKNIQCVEMEGAATAQVCDSYQIPYTVIRIISDQANAQASFSFELFIDQLASVMIQGMVRLLLPVFSLE